MLVNITALLRGPDDIEIEQCCRQCENVDDLRAHCRCVTVQILNPGKDLDEYIRYVSI